MVARYGGEEIIIYMYDTREIMNVYSRMDGIRKIIEKSSVEYNGKLCPVTVSMGISLSHDKNENIEDMIKRADMNLYKAKNSGKNKVVC
jgi:diguanylate cyclase (GGDEF)-like protein